MRQATLAAAAIVFATLGLLSCDHSPTGPRVDQLTLDVVSGDRQAGVVATQLAPLIVKVTSAGNPVSQQVLNFRVVSGGGSVYGGTELTDDHGIAQELWTLGTDASMAQKVEVRAVESRTGAQKVFATFTATATPDKAFSLSAAAGNNQTAAVGSMVPISPAARVADQYGNPVSGVLVDFLRPATGSVTARFPTTGPDGIATLGSWTLGPTAGTNTLLATAPGLSLTGDPVTFTATGTGPAGLNITTFRGDGQTLPIGSMVPIAPAVQLTDQSGGPVAGVMVTFSVTAGGGSITGASQVTDFNGIATVGGWTLGAVPGVNELQAGFNTGVSRGSTIFVATGELTFLTVNAGNGSVCGVTPLRTAYCWGANASGQLGTTTTETCPFGPCSTTPAAVSGGLTFASVLTGDGYTCGLTLNGAAFCWGDNSVGQLGNGTMTGGPTPSAVAGGQTFTMISVGFDNDHTCAVTTGGVAYCWGINGSGELGTSTSQTCNASGTTVACSPTPLAVSGAPTFATISAGDGYTCGLTPSGAAYCWGDNTFGQLGNGTTTPSPTPVPVAGGLTFAQLSAGYSNACAVTTTGAAYCWGDNSVGQLGTGTATGSATPIAVAGGLTFTAVSVGFGGDHTCGVTTSGAAYCWGNNVLGGLGDGTQNRSLTPVAVVGGLSFKVVSVGGLNTSGVTTGNIAYTWGSNGVGQAGNGTSGNAHANTVPVKVAGQP